MNTYKLFSLALVCALALALATTSSQADFTVKTAAGTSLNINVPATAAAAQPNEFGVALAAQVDAGAQQQAAGGNAAPRKHENAFLHALAAPFRALARLFGGSGAKSATAKRTPPVAQPQQTATASAPPTTRSKATPQPQPTVAPISAPSAQRKDKVALPAGPDLIAQGNAPSFTEQPMPPPPAPAPTQPRKFTPVLEGVALDPLSQGRALLERDYTNEALAQLSIAAVTGPDLITANNLLGLAYDRLGQHKQAQEYYERALTAAPNDAATLNNLGYSLYLDDRYADALARLKSAARRDPASPQVANNLALVYSRLQKYDEAYKQFARAGGELYARLQTGARLETAGRDRDAIKHFEAARRLSPADAEVLRHLINLYQRTGQPGKAEDAQRRLNNKPDNKRADSSSSSSSV